MVLLLVGLRLAAVRYPAVHVVVAAVAWADREPVRPDPAGPRLLWLVVLGSYPLSPHPVVCEV